MKNIMFRKIYLLGLLVILVNSACAQQQKTTPPPPAGNTIVKEKDDVRDPPPLFEFPRPDGFLNDFAEALSDKEEKELESLLVQFKDRAKIDFSVALIISTDERTPFDYSLAMAKEWKIGSENGGILLLVAVEDRKWWIQIDKKLQAHLTDAEVKKIGDVMVPDFKAKNYGAGIKKCVDKMISELENKTGKAN